MSHENVELVRSLQPEPGMDLVALFRDEAGAARLLDALGPFLHDDVVIVAGAGILGQGSWVGLEGLKAAWAEWRERTAVQHIPPLLPPDARPPVDLSFAPHYPRVGGPPPIA